MDHIARTLLGGLLIAVVPAGTASAATDVADTVREIAGEAVEIVLEEQALVGAIADERIGDAADVEARLRSVDARGTNLLARFDGLDVELSQAVRVALGANPIAPNAGDPARNFPAVELYAAAAADLVRIAETPESVLGDAGDGDGPATGLLIVAAVSLLVLGAAAFGNSLRRRPDTDLVATAWSDGLTGLANRRRLDADVGERGDDPTAAIMVDVDHFASINDDFGYALGDEILQQVCRRLTQHVRHDDVVYRSGGGEFCILLPGASTSDAGDIADRIVDAVRGIELPDGRHVTVSAGVAGDGDAASVLRRADQAMYAAKQSGRDRSVSSDGLGVAG